MNTRCFRLSAASSNRATSSRLNGSGNRPERFIGTRRSTFRPTTLRRFELRDGNSGLIGKELRLIPPGRWAVADFQRFWNPSRRPSLRASVGATDAGYTQRGHNLRKPVRWPSEAVALGWRFSTASEGHRTKPQFVTACSIAGATRAWRSSRQSNYEFPQVTIVKHTAGDNFTGWRASRSGSSQSG